MRIPIGLFALAAVSVVGWWWWLGAPVAMPASPLAPGEKLYCVSYAPFRADQSPLDPSVRVEPWQIEDDLTRLSAITDCVRTYSTDFGLEQVPELARRYGLKVIQGLWLSREADKNRVQVEAAVALAKRYPDVITAVVVGGTSLRGGRGTFIGTVLGAVLLTEVLNAVAFLGLSETYQYVFQGKPFRQYDARKRRCLTA